MYKINENYQKLPGSYLFSTIAKKVAAFTEANPEVGSMECKEGKIFIEPQGFCVLADIGIQEGHAKKALDSVKQHLDTKYGIVLQQPPYSHYYVNLGEISSYPPGYKENAGRNI